MPKRVAVMQPYFFPYAGYFRLFASVDEFVIYDCVQFRKGGRVHRTEVPGPAGRTEWLTLPLDRHPVDTRIDRVRFAPGARTIFDQRLARLPWVSGASGPNAGRIRSLLYGSLPDSLTDYLEAALRLVVDLLGLPVTISRSSLLDLDPSLRGQARVIAVVGAVGATHYVNSPGGRGLYDPRVFERHGITLSYLNAYEGRFFHMLPALLTKDAHEVRQDILATSHLTTP